MANRATQLNLKVNGIDAATGVFQRVAMSASKIGRALAAIGASAGIAKSVFHLGRLSDVAMQAGMSAPELTKMSKAMELLGMRGSEIGEIARSMAYMTRSTGAEGYDGFKRVVAEIAKLPSAAERADASMKVFGRSGFAYLPMIEQMAQGDKNAIDEVARSLQGVSDTAADAGDAVADAWGIMTENMSSMFFETIGYCCGLLDENFTGGAREAAIVGSQYFRSSFKIAGRAAAVFGTNCSKTFDFIQSHWGEITDHMGELFKQSIATWWNLLKAFYDQFKKMQDRLVGLIKAGGMEKLFDLSALKTEVWDPADFKTASKEFAREMKRIEGEHGLSQMFKDLELDSFDISDIIDETSNTILNASKASKAMQMKREIGGDDDGFGLAKSAGVARNDLIMGGSYASLTAGIRQQNTMEKVRLNTGKMCDLLKGVKENTESLKEMEVA